MFLNHVDSPNKQALTEVMRKVNAFGHAPRVIIELDKFSHVPGLKRKYEVIEYIMASVTQNSVAITYPTGGGTGETDYNVPVIPVEGQTATSMPITSRHRTVNASRPKHKGLDIDLAIGDPVVATWSGKVTEVKYNEGGYGHYVTIDHGNGFKTRYAHLDKPLVSTGEIVKAGQRIGLGGNSGGVRSTTGDGSHLHFEIWKDGVDIDPEPILKGGVVVNGTTKGTKTTTVTTSEQRISYTRDYSTQSVDNKINMQNSELFMIGTPGGFKKVIGAQGIQNAGQRKTFTFQHTWFNEGHLEFSYVYQKVGNADNIELRRNGVVIWSQRGGNNPQGLIFPAAIRVPKGTHTFEFSFSSSIPTTGSRYGVASIKAVEYVNITKQVEVPVEVTTPAPAPVEEYTPTAWDYEDGMDNMSRWTSYGLPGGLSNGGDYIYFSKTGTAGESGMFRSNVVNYPFSMQFRTKVSDSTTRASMYVGNGSRRFNVDIRPDRTGTYMVDNTDWQDYMIVLKSATTGVLFHSVGGDWVDTEVTLTSEASSDNRLAFRIPTGETGTVYVDDVKYAAKDYSTTTPTTRVEERVTPTWYELGGFAFDETLYIDDDVMNWEVDEHADMSSATARITLSNHHGLYSPEYIRDATFPDNLRKNPFSYIENGEVRHVISEYTPVRIYVGYGEQMVRRFTGMIKGEIEEDSEQRTITFNCVDRFDLLEECILLKTMQFPPEEAFSGDAVPRPWIKSSIVQALANHAGMVGWRYTYEDLMHPDLAIEDTYFTDVNQTNNTFMKFDANGQLKEVTLGDVKTPNGYKNPFVEAIAFQAGERVSDCIRRIVDEINFRVYVNRYGTFVMHHLDFENNAKWDFRSGDNLYSLNTSTDYARIRNHIIVTGSHGNQEHFFDKDLLIATKGHMRTAKLEMPWIDESDGTSARGAKQIVADKLFFDMKRQSRTKNVVIKGNPFIEVMDGCYVYDDNTSTAGYYIIKGNRLIGDANGMVNQLELTWEEKP